MVGVKDFSIPKTCEDCKFYNEEGGILNKITCDITSEDLSNEDSYTISNTCPLIEITTE